MIPRPLLSTFFFFNDTATTEIYTLSLHDALPISIHAFFRYVGARHPEQLDLVQRILGIPFKRARERAVEYLEYEEIEDRKSTRLNSSHSQISYAVFCLKKKKKYK